MRLGGGGVIVPFLSPQPGYNNLANWPQLAGLNSSVSNRPVFLNGVLSWTGPLLGDPSTTNDVAQTLILTPSAPVTSTSAGQVISGLAIFTTSNAITVAHNNVTVKQCVTSVNTYPGLGIMIQAGVTGTIIKDCLVIGQNSQAQGGIAGIGGSGISTPMQQTRIYRCVISGVEKGIAWGHQGISGYHNIYSENYIHGVAGTDCDMTQFYNANGADSYTDVLHNYFDATDVVVNAIQTLGTITGGSGYTPGTYYGIPLTGGSGSQASANITVNGSGVVSVVTLLCQGWNYSTSDTLSASSIYLGPGSGFLIPVATVNASQANADSAINLTNFNSSDTMDSINFSGNAISWGGNLVSVHPYLADNTQGTGPMTNFSVTNNGFFSVISPNYSEIKAGVGIIANSGNYIMANALATTGSPTKGTGAV